jgi:hypothetical protein
MPVWGAGQPIVVILAVSLSRDYSWKSFKLPARHSQSGIDGVDRSLPKASQWDGFVIRQRFASGLVATRTASHGFRENGFAERAASFIKIEYPAPLLLVPFANCA